MKVWLIIRYVLFVLFKTAIYGVVYTGAFVLLTNGGKITGDMIPGILLLSPIAIAGWYDWLRSVLLFWWVDDSETFPCWWEGGRRYSDPN